MDRFDIPKLLFSSALIAYIVSWFYVLFTTIIPQLSVPISIIFDMTLFQLVTIFLFLTFGVCLLIACFGFLFIAIVD